MIKKIFQLLKPNYFLDYIFILILFYNFFTFIILPFFIFGISENKIIQSIIIVTTFHYRLLIPKNAELGAVIYFILIPIVIAILINLLALIIKSVTGKIKYSSIIGATLFFVLLSLSVTQIFNTVVSIKDGNLQKEREVVGKKMFINLEKCHPPQGSDDSKQLECKYTISNAPAIDEPYISIVVLSDDWQQGAYPGVGTSLTPTRVSNNTYGGNLKITKMEGIEFSSIYVRSFVLQDGFKNYPSKDLKLYLTL